MFNEIELEAGIEVECSPIEMSYLISQILTEGGAFYISGNVLIITEYPKGVFSSAPEHKAADPDSFIKEQPPILVSDPIEGAHNVPEAPLHVDLAPATVVPETPEVEALNEEAVVIAALNTDYDPAPAPEVIVAEKPAPKTRTRKPVVESTPDKDKD